MAATSLAGESSCAVLQPRFPSTSAGESNTHSKFAKSGQKSANKILSSFARELEMETCGVVAAVVGQIPRSSLLVVCEHLFG